LLDVFAARKRIAPYVMRTPLHRYPGLDRLIGTEVFVKHENHHSLGAFKIRGALNVISQLTEEEKSRGVICASTGNFGQGIAYAASVFGVQARVFVPEDANPDKCAAMRGFGADLVHHGANFDEARTECERRAEAEGSVYIHSADEPRLIPGVATYALEIFEDLPDVDVIVVPVGAGSGACGTCIVADSINPQVRVIGVQSEAAPAAFLSWKSGEIVAADAGTVAEGLSTSVGFGLTQQIMRALLDDFLLVSDDELVRAVDLYLETTHNLAEHAGAAPLAAAIRHAESLKGRKVVLVLSGGNISRGHLRKALAQGSN
jgi:threonine dehydratase